MNTTNIYNEETLSAKILENIFAKEAVFLLYSEENNDCCALSNDEFSGSISEGSALKTLILNICQKVKEHDLKYQFKKAFFNENSVCDLDGRYDIVVFDYSSEIFSIKDKINKIAHECIAKSTIFILSQDVDENFKKMIFPRYNSLLYITGIKDVKDVKGVTVFIPTIFFTSHLTNYIYLNHKPIRLWNSGVVPDTVMQTEVMNKGDLSKYKKMTSVDFFQTYIQDMLSSSYVPDEYSFCLFGHPGDTDVEKALEFVESNFHVCGNIPYDIAKDAIKEDNCTIKGLNLPSNITGYLQALYANSVKELALHFDRKKIYVYMVTIVKYVPLFQGCSSYSCFFVSTIKNINLAAIIGTRLSELDFFILKDTRNRLLAKSIKSAISAIMARNISHNLGSHVMFYIKQKLQSVEKIKEGGVLRDLYDPNEPVSVEDVSDFLNSALTENRTELPFLVGLGRFINYLQERQDYIATIATDYIPPYSSINFKDFIYDELKADLKYERHEELNGAQPRNVLLDYIAYSDGYHNSNSIVLKFGDFDGKKTEAGSKEKQSLHELRKFDIALPGGGVGRQALFSIIENLIRNAAKHSQKRKDGNLVIQFDIIDPNDKTQFKNIAACREINGVVRDIDADKLIEQYQNISEKYEILKITSQMPNNEDDINALIKKLAEPYINPDGSMNDSSKGLKEIRISAAWLRACSIDTELPMNEPPAIAIAKAKYNDDHLHEKTHTIAYYLCLRRPQKVAFIVEKLPERYTNIKKALNIKGYRIFTINEENLAFKISDYEMVIFCVADNEKFDHTKLVSYISARYISYNEKNISIMNNLIEYANDLEKLEKLLGDIYKIWFDDFFGKDESETQLSILDEKLGEGSGDNKGKILVSTTLESDSEYYNDKIIFSTHYKGLKEEGDSNPSVAAKYVAAKFVESISGGNSTDRLIRQSKKTEEWTYKHLTAGLVRIAIFDERIFNSLISTENAYELIDLNKKQSIIEKIEKTLTEKDIDEEMKYNRIFEKISGLFLSPVTKNVKMITSKIIASCSAENTVKDIVDEQLAWLNKGVDKVQIFHEKRVWFYDIKCDETQGKVEIIGYNAPIEENIGKFNANERSIAVIGSIIKDDDGNYNVDIGTDLSNKFNIISIHQGILDKIYAFFKVGRNKAAKCKITDAIYTAFSKIALQKMACNFLPLVIIHSGRSKPNKDDMPQEQPFVQFSALDHAVRDCKYTLTELLLTAHYEKNNSNN